MKIFGKRHTLKKEIIRIVTKMEGMDPTSKEYTEAVTNLETLTSAQGNKSKCRSLLEIALPGAMTLAGIVLVIYSEQTGIITSKAFGLIPKGRV